jgi:hypothetical protein
MIGTPELIETLAANATPVRRLRPPLARAALWVSVAALVLILIALSHGARPDLAQRVQEPTFVVSIAASLLTGVLAAIASFLISLPDRSRFWSVLPLPALIVWMSTIGYGCLTDWVAVDAGSVHLGEAARCFATLVLTSAPLSLLMFAMVRHAAPLRPMPVAMTGSLAVAAMASSALSLFHAFDASVMILVWNVGSAALLVALGALLGARMLSWPPQLPKRFPGRTQ